jgi:hypothetical protein
MKRLLWAAAIVVAGTLTNAQVGQKANLDVVKWYNSPPISADQLQGHGVLVEVFRTW